MKRFINRLPMLLFILTLVSLVLMIAVRISGSGTKLLSTGSGLGRLIAAYYHPSVVVFIIILVLYMLVILTVRMRQYHRKKREIAENEAFTPGEVEYPPSTVLSMEQIEASDPEAPEQVLEPENAEDAEIISEVEAPAAFEEEAEISPEAETPENLENQD